MEQDKEKLKESLQLLINIYSNYIVTQSNLEEAEKTETALAILETALAILEQVVMALFWVNIQEVISDEYKEVVEVIIEFYLQSLNDFLAK